MKRLNTLIFALMLIFSNVVAKSSSNELETVSNTNIPEQYLPTNKSFINWDYPVVGYTGIDIDYKMTGYDWSNRDLNWELISGPEGMSINPNDGTIHWVAASEGSYNVTVQLNLGNEETISKSFTISVDNSRSIFISPDGNNETGTGSKDKPFASFGEQVAKRIVDLGGKVTIYHRAGTYGELNLDWFSRNNPNLRKLHDVLNVSKDNAIIFRNYPGEKAIIKPGKNGMRIYGNHWIYYGLDFQGASIGLTVAKESVAKRVNVYESTLTGVLINGNGVLDQVVSGDEEDKNIYKHPLASNFHFSNAKGNTKDAFIIDSLSLHNSTTGFKVTNPNDKVFLHIHKSADLGAISSVEIAQNYSSVRNSFFYSKYYYPVVSIGGVRSLTHSNKGMLFQNNVIISNNEKGRAVKQDSLVMVDDANNPIIWDNNIIETTSQSNASLYLTGAKEPFSIKFDNNTVYSKSPSNSVSIGSTTYGADKLFTYGVNNKTVSEQGDYTIKVAGRAYNIANGEVTQVTIPEEEPEEDKEMPDEYYLPEKLSFISWDYPVVGHTGVNVDYKMTGYDWFDRKLIWSVVSGPEGMLINPDNGTISWEPKEEGEYPVTIQLELLDEKTMKTEKITKEFTITIDNSRCIFIAMDGDDENGDGSINNPFASINERLGLKLYNLKGKATIYYREGTHDFRAEFGRAKFLPPLSRDEAITIRNYPGEQAIVHPVTYSFKSETSHWIYYGFEISGGKGTEGAGLSIYGESVAKKMYIHGYRHPANENPSGLKMVGTTIVDEVIVKDNYDQYNPYLKNNSNFLFYGDGTRNGYVGDAFIINSLSLGYSGVGFKIKHAGPYGILHIHKSASLEVNYGFAGGENHASVRNSIFYTNNNYGNTFSTGGSDNMQNATRLYHDEGMLIQNNLIVSINSKHAAVSQDAFNFYDDPNHSLYYDNNIIESIGNYDRGNLFITGTNVTSGPMRVFKFSNSKLYTDSPDNGFWFNFLYYSEKHDRDIISFATDPITKLFEFGTGNEVSNELGTYNFTVAGCTYSIDKGILENKNVKLEEKEKCTSIERKDPEDPKN